jgi:flagellar biosynthesis chaperone FliJ
MTSEPDVDPQQELIVDLRQALKNRNNELSSAREQINNLRAELMNCQRFLGIISSSRMKISKRFWDESPLVFGTVGTDPETGHMVIIRT